MKKMNECRNNSVIGFSEESGKLSDDLSNLEWNIDIHKQIYINSPVNHLKWCVSVYIYFNTVHTYSHKALQINNELYFVKFFF